MSENDNPLDDAPAAQPGRTRRTTGISLDPEILPKAKERMKALGHRTFSAYLEQLIREDLDALAGLSEKDIAKIAAQVAALNEKPKKKRPRQLGGNKGIINAVSLPLAACLAVFCGFTGISTVPEQAQAPETPECEVDARIFEIERDAAEQEALGKFEIRP